MAAPVRLTELSDDGTVEPKSCIICQSVSSGRTTSTPQGRKRIREVADTLQDVVYKRLKVIEDDDFVYHSNECYKNYTHKKTVAQQLPATEYDCTKIDISNSSRRRSSVDPRPKPTPDYNIFNKICVICGNISYKRSYEKFRISEGPRAKKFLEATCFFKDDVYTRTCDLQDIESVFGSKIYCHGQCTKRYLIKYDRAKESSECTMCDKNIQYRKQAWDHILQEIEDGLAKGLGYELSYVRKRMNDYILSCDSIGAGGDTRCSVTNREVKILLTNHFDEKIRFSTPKQLNKSMMFFKNDIAEQMAETIRISDPIKQAASMIKDALLSVDFDLNDRFCDSKDLEESWENTKIPEPLLQFFASFLNFDSKDFYSMHEVDDITNDEEQPLDSSCKVSDEKRRKANSLFQIMFFMLHNGCKRTPMHIMNSEAIYDACKSSTLITSFNHFGLCTSYDELLRFQNDMASFTIEASEGDVHVPFPSHFTRNMFTMAAFDNFDHEEATLSGIGGSHDTVTVLFQDDGEQNRKKPRISQSKVEHGPKSFDTELQCQNLQTFHKPSHRADLPDTYLVSDTHVDHHDLLKYYREVDIAWILGRVDLSELSSQIAFAQPKKQCMPIWSGANSLLCVDKVPLKRIGFLPVLPYPVTQFDTVYSSLKNLQDILKHLDQPSLSVTCDEGVYRIAREIQLIHPEEFSNIVLCLGSFHMAKVALGCIGKYLKSSGAESILIESGTFGVNVVESVMNGRHYNRSLKGLQLLKEAMSRLQWAEFFKKESNVVKHKPTMLIVEKMRNSIRKKAKDEIREHLSAFRATGESLITDFDMFVKEQCDERETFQFWNTFLNMMTKVENLIRSDRLGDWNLHLQSIKDLLPLFAAFDSTNYLRWCSLYLEDMCRLPETSPTTHVAFMEGRFAIKRTPGSFNAIGADMALEQTINKAQKSSSGIIGNSRKKNYVAKWEILYHEMLAITNLHRKLSSSFQNSYEQDVNRSYSAASTQSDEKDIQAIIDVIHRNENPFSATFCKNLHNIMTNEIVPEIISKEVLKAEIIGIAAYSRFREKRFIKKTERISGVIHRNNIKTFASVKSANSSGKKSTQRKTPKSQETAIRRTLDIAKERGHGMQELLKYDISCTSYLFDDEGMMKSATKSDLTKELEKHLLTESKKKLFDTMNTVYLVDVMANIRKIRANAKETKTFGEFVHNFLTYVQNVAKRASRIDFVFDSYIDKTIKDSERQKRAKSSAVELSKINRETPLPVQMETFWASSRNKANLESLIHQDAMLYPWNGYIAEVLVSAFDRMHGESLKSFKLVDDIVIGIPGLNEKVEEADMRLIIHVLHASKEGHKRVAILSQDTDVLIMCLYNWIHLSSYGLQELWVTAGIGDSHRFIPVHELAVQLGDPLCKVLPAVHTLTGCDYTSKFGTKAAALKASPETFLKGFGTTEVDIENTIQLAEKYLVQVRKKDSLCDTIDQLRYYEYHHSKSLDLPPTSHATRLHILRSFYVTYQMTKLLTATQEQIDPTLYGFQETDNLLVPQIGRNPIPEEFTIKCQCSKCASERCPCRMKHRSCCSFCKCRSALRGPECKNPLG